VRDGVADVSAVVVITFPVLGRRTAVARARAGPSGTVG